MIGVLVDNEAVATVPAPIGTDRPVPRSDFKVNATRKSEAMMVAIDSHNRVAIAGPEMFKMTVLKRVVQVKALVEEWVRVPDLRAGYSDRGPRAHAPVRAALRRDDPHSDAEPLQGVRQRKRVPGWA